MRMLPRAGAGLLMLWVCAAVVASFSVSSDEAQARLDYFKVFDKMCSSDCPMIKKVKCKVCHPGKSKKERGVFGKVVEEAIGEKKCKDKAKIEEGLKKALEQPSQIPGKTFGDLIKEGILPDTKPESE